MAVTFNRGRRMPKWHIDRPAFQENALLRTDASITDRSILRVDAEKPVGFPYGGAP